MTAAGLGSLTIINLHVYVVCVAQVLPYLTLYVERADYAEYLSILHGSKGFVQSMSDAVRPVGPAWQDFCHFFRIRCARCRRRCTDDVIIVMEQFPYHPGIIFIGQDREEEYPFPVPEYITVGLAERIDAGRIVRPVDDDVGLS